MQIRHGIIALVLSLALLLAEQLPASAHAQLRSATPAVGGTAASSPAEVLVNFSEPLRRRSAPSSFVMRSANGSIRPTRT